VAGETRSRPITTAVHVRERFFTRILVTDRLRTPRP